MSAATASVHIPGEIHGPVARLLPRHRGHITLVPDRQRATFATRKQEIDPLDGVDPEILELTGTSDQGFEEFRYGLPAGFGPELGQHLVASAEVTCFKRRRASLRGLDVDLDDPERAYAGCEPRYLPRL